MIFIRINESWKKLWGNDWNIWVVSESTEEFPWIVEYRGWCHAAHAAPVPWILQKSKSARYQRSSAVTWRSATLLWDHIWEPAKCKEAIGLAQFLGYDISMDILWYHLVGGIPTPLKNMSSSVGMIFFPTEWKVIKFHGSCSTKQFSIPFLFPWIPDTPVMRRDKRSVTRGDRAELKVMTWVREISEGNGGLYGTKTTN